jgi:4-amino-4-deoxy-L-arabinose transferase-like glycosyltransferase
MNGLLAALAVVVLVGILVIAPTVGLPAISLLAPIAAIALWATLRTKSDRRFLAQLFVSALLLRMLVGTLIYAFQLQEFFGGDANTYDYFGNLLVGSWSGDQYYAALLTQSGAEGAGAGWGMIYLVAAVYRIVGRNMLAMQFVNAVMGAATPVVTYLISVELFSNRRVARVAAFFAAFFPSLVLWSSQGLKDGPIIFSLVVSMLAVLRLGKQFSIKYLVLLIFGLLGLLTLRFYVFYMMLAAVVSAFAIGLGPVNTKSFVRQFTVVIAIGLALTYFGVIRAANIQFETFGNLEAVQRSHLDMAQSAGSGFGKDVDVSTTYGALRAIPLGMLYLLFAPFPWEVTNLRQSITIPEMIVWWLSFPMLVVGLWFTIKYRLRQVSPILLFTTMLTLAYSVFQGNVGTAYRQRSQLLVFYFVFVAVGYTLIWEWLTNKKSEREIAEAESTEARARVLAAAKRPSGGNVQPVAGDPAFGAKL